MFTSKEAAVKAAEESTNAQVDKLCDLINEVITEHGIKMGNFKTAVMIRVSGNVPPHVIERVRRGYEGAGWHCDYRAPDCQFVLS